MRNSEKKDISDLESYFGGGGTEKEVRRIEGRRN